MIQCPNCKIMHPVNTLYCNECGEYLGDDKKDTEALMSDLPDGSAFADERLDEFEREDLTSPPSGLILAVGQAEHHVAVSLKKEILLGRVDPTNNNYPEVDLTDYEGAEQGVSRRHARILCQQNEVVIEDLGSVNGSFVNGKPLIPYLAHPLRNGDLLRLGKMKIKVMFPAKNTKF